MMKKIKALSLLVALILSAPIQAQMASEATSTTFLISTVGLGVTTGTAGLPAGLAAAGVMTVATAFIDQIDIRYKDLKLAELKADALDFLAEGRLSTHFLDFTEDVYKTNEGSLLSEEQIASAILILEFK